MGGSNCERCGARLTGDDVGLHRKMINREAESFLCKACLAKEFNCSIAYLDNRILQFKQAGCLLFPPLED